jgi:hypothetical protein
MLALTLPGPSRYSPTSGPKVVEHLGKLASCLAPCQNVRAPARSITTTLVTERTGEAGVHLGSKHVESGRPRRKTASPVPWEKHWLSRTQARKENESQKRRRVADAEHLLQTGQMGESTLARSQVQQPVRWKIEGRSLCLTKVVSILKTGKTTGRFVKTFRFLQTTMRCLPL